MMKKENLKFLFLPNPFATEFKENSGKIGDLSFRLNN